LPKIEAVQVQSRELKRLASLAQQQTDLRDEPSEVSVAASSLPALHQQAIRLVERLEEKVESG